MKLLKGNILDNKLPSHEQMVFALLLTFVGGFFDSYTFINSHGIFANAQTGNLIFFSIEIANKNYNAALSYLPPVCFFIIGVIFNEYITSSFKHLSVNRYINFSLLIQILVLILAYLIPFAFGVDIRPLLISFVCAMQYDGFRTVQRIPFASIFCTGNLRSASEHLFQYVVLKQKASKGKIFIYVSLILFFLLGVMIGGVISNKVGHHAILIAIGVLIIDFILGVYHDRKTRLI